MGGRGQSISGKSFDNFGKERGAKFYDRTEQYKGMNLMEFENMIRDRKSEFIGIFDKNGKLLIAGTSGLKGKVAVPTNDPRMKGAYILTHNHPYSGNRGIGGTFSEADMYVHASLKLKQTRAVSNGRISRGKKERVHIMQSKKNADYEKLYGAVSKIEKTKQLSKTGKATVEKVEKNLNKKNKSLSRTQRSSAYLGGMKKIYKNNKSIQDAGFEYYDVKRKVRKNK